MSDPEPQRTRDFERFITFVDAIVAIAITLLVLPLVDLTTDLREGDSVATLLREHQAEFWGFLLSFVVIMRLWFFQHRSVRQVLRWDTRVAQCLMVWSLTIVVLPFPTALLATTASQTVTKVLYIGTIALSTASLCAVDAVVARRPEITDGAPPRDRWPAVGNLVALLVALLVSLVVPHASYFPLLLLLVERPVRERVKARWQRHHAG